MNLIQYQVVPDIPTLVPTLVPTLEPSTNVGTQYYATIGPRTAVLVLAVDLVLLFGRQLILYVLCLLPLPFVFLTNTTRPPGRSIVHDVEKRPRAGDGGRGVYLLSTK